tara:strand:+ start:116 stop:664 length:549 start_codon:yes stop_codon:yes gene_type:complete
MKIYFDGCSFTYGNGLKDKLRTRYSQLVCNHYGAEEYNIARGGGSNHRIARNLLSADLSEYDMVVLQMTKRQRTEYCDGGDWKRVGLGNVMRKRDNEFWMTYYKDIYSDTYGIADEKIYYNLFRGMLRDKPHVILSIEEEPSVPVDFHIGKNIPRVDGNRSNRHPNEEGHQLICEGICESIL